MLAISYSSAGLKSVLEFCMDHIGENKETLKEITAKMLKNRMETETKAKTELDE
jgi:hypothetical protein